MVVHPAPLGPRLRLISGGARRAAHVIDAAELLRDEMRTTRIAAALAGASVAALAWAGARLPVEPLVVGLAVAAMLFQSVIGAPTRGRARHTAASHALTCAAFVAFGLPAAIIVAALRGAFAGVGSARRDPATVLTSLGAGTLAAAAAGALAHAIASGGGSPFVAAAAFVVCSALIEVGLVMLAARRQVTSSVSLLRRAAYFCALLAAFGAAGGALGSALSSGAWAALVAFVVLGVMLRIRDHAPRKKRAGDIELVSAELQRITRLRSV